MAKNVKIAIYTPLDPTLVGGMRTWLERLWLPLCLSGAVELRVVHTGTRPAHDPGAYKPFAVAPWETRLLAGRPLPATNAKLPAVRDLRDALSGSDAVYVDNGYLWQDRVALDAARAAGVARIVSGHHSVIVHDWGSLEGILHNAAWMLSGIPALRRFDAVHALNSTDARYLRRCGGEDVCVVPLPVDTRTFTPGDKSDRFTAIFVGRLHRQKGIDRLVRVIREAERREIPVDFRVIGAGPEYATLEPFVQTGRVALQSGLPADAVAREMRQAHVLIAPSRTETFGFVAAEALACGTPVVCSNTHGFADLVGSGNGEIIDRPDNGCEWIAAIERIRSLSPAGYAELASRARASAERLSYECVAEQTLALFRGREFSHH